MAIKPFAVLGTDGRMKAAAAVLRQAGYHTNGTAGAPRLLLPVPLTEDTPGYQELLRSAPTGALAFGGAVSPGAAQMAADAGVTLLDYYTREELVWLNAIPTAEGCIALLMQRRRRTVWGSRLLITGFGCVAIQTARCAAALGADIVVIARSAGQRAAAQASGYAAFGLEELARQVARCDAAINTVPALLFDSFVLRAMRPGTLLLDLAGGNGGVDWEAAHRAGVQAEWARGLPGKCAPDTAGEFVGRAVLSMLQERGEQP